jgi:twitching motility protein PilT
MPRIEDYLRKLDSVGASDLLLSSDRTPLYRAQNELLPLPGEGVLDDVTLRAGLHELVNPDEWAGLQAQQELLFVVDVAPDLRVRGLCSIAQHGLTARLTRLRGSPAGLSDLQLPASFANLAAADSGMVIVTGPAGSGKTTLIATLCDLVCCQRAVHLTSLGTGAEYLQANRLATVSQREIGRHSSSFANALDTALDTDADVIACSSLSAEGAFERLVEAASAGVLVFAEVPGQGSANALEHLLLCAPENQRSQLALDLAESLLAVISLDLLPKKGGGRVPAAEILLCTPNVAALVRDGKVGMVAGLLDREPGMQSMDRCLIELATRGLIDGREAHARALDKRAFAAWG